MGNRKMSDILEELIEDLRFFIGLFFLITSVILLAQGLMHPVETAGVNMNIDVGIGFFVFSIVLLTMVLVSFRKRFQEVKGK